MDAVGQQDPVFRSTGEVECGKERGGSVAHAAAGVKNVGAAVVTGGPGRVVVATVPSADSIIRSH